ncbi:MAG TPA: hypothetical protein VIP31_06380 [Acidovorax sp.]
MTKPWEQDWDTPSAADDERKPWERDWGVQDDSGSKARPERTVLGTVGDVGVTALKGAVGLPQAFMGLADIVSGGQAGKDFEDAGVRFGDAQKMLDGLYSPAQQAANREVQQADGFVGTLKAAIDNPSTIATTVGESLPQMLGGAAIARGGLALTSKLAPWAAGAIGEGVMGAGAAAEQIRAENPDGLLAGKQAAAAVGSGIGTAALGAVGGKFANSKLGQRLGVSDVDTMLAAGKFNKSPVGFVRQLVGSGISEGVFEELPQSIQEQMWQNYAQGKPLDEGVGKAAAMGLLAGSAMGGAGGGFNAAQASLLRNSDPAPAAAPGLAVDVTYQTPDGQTVTSQGSAPASPSVATADTTEAEKALRTPVALTALDRANEIDSEASSIRKRLAEISLENGYGPAFDQERQDLAAQATALEQERAGIAATWPKAVTGAPTAFSTEAGVKLDGTYALMDAGDLVTSHTESLRPNPLYPQELQPRDRSRNASEMQVSGIVQKLDPARLGLSADAATGAPIVGADGLVESGNARTIAMKRVYQANGQKAADYKQFLRDNAAQFGLTPEAVDALEKPVLVRVRSTPVNRAEFARQANASTVQRMSPSEQALSDAKRLTSLDGLNPDEDGNFSNSHDFIRQFMATLPITEQSDLIESDGRLSTAGYRRIQNAVLGRAYGDSPSLRRMTESMDNNLVNVSKALLRVAPTIAAARERMQGGTLHQADIAPDLLAAVEGLSALKEKGWTVDQELAQIDLTGPKYTPEAAELLAFLSDNIRSPRRIAEFFQRYYDALAQAGDPSQPSMFGDDGPAPARADLLKQAQGAKDGGTQNNAQIAGQNPQWGVHREGAQAAAQNGWQPEDAPGRGRSNEGDGPAGANEAGGQPGQPQGQAAASNDAGEWVAFPAESGTLGIPRRDMPQVKGEHRGALIQFLKARGIDSRQEEVQPDTLKPTQAEFSTKKVAKFTETGAMGERSVLVSSDGYVLDGHHQWMGHQAMGDEVPVIRLDAPIKELLATVREFPSVQRSEGATAASNDVGDRAQAVTDFKDALADLAQIASKHTRAAMVPENTPELMPTLVKLYDAGIKLLGTDLKILKKWVGEQLKKDARFKIFWNKIGNDIHQKAALQALDQMDAPAQAGLFDSPEAATGALQSDLFAQPAANPKAATPKVATINGKPYNLARDNFRPPAMSSFIDADVLVRADGYVQQFYSQATPYAMPAEARAEAERMLAPFLKRAEDTKAAFDQKVIDIAASTGALGQMLADIKGIKRAAEKMHQDATEEGREMRAADVKDLLRSTVVVRSYADVGQVVEAIRGEFDVVREKDKTTTAMREKQGGYADYTVFVKMPNGVLAEVQINMPEMLAAKGDHGHKLFEAARDLPAGSERKAQIIEAMTEIYQAAFSSADRAKQATNAASVAGAPVRGPRGSMPGSAVSDAPSSDALNQRPSGNLTYSSPEKLKTNSQPSGNLSGTLIESPFGSIVGDGMPNDYNSSTTKGANDANAQPGEGGAQGQGTGAVPATGRQGEADGVRARSGRRDQKPNSDDDASGPGPRQVGRPGGDGVRSQDEDGGRAQPGNRPRGNAAVPAGRDIPAKSGLNYEFGPDDLTYEGSWVKKAAQNIEAVELLRRLEKEGRHATREEQKTLAKFAGWGSSELANNLFGKKLDKASSALEAYDKAIKAMEAKGATELVAGGYKLIGYRRQYVAGDPAYMDAFRVLQAKTPDYKYNADHAITRAELDAARPDASTRKWLALRERLQAILTPAELAEASRSTQYAHYTSKSVVKSMWRAMERMGFKGGTILEPGAGIGVFAGLMPQAMAFNSSYTGIEFDGVTGGILKQLFPDERILVESFVDSTLPKNFYDVAIGNPPFSAIKILGDPEYAKLSLSLHDYFFAKSIDRTKPGGLVVYVTSRYTMDKLDDKARKYLSERADLVGAIRLPQTAFKQNAGTDVVTDVIFLRKKMPGETFAGAQAWSKSVPIQAGAKTFPINEYFHAHPEMVLGQHSDAGSMQNSPEPQYTVTPLAGDIEEHFSKAIERLPANIYQPARGSSAEAAQVREIDFNPKAKKEGNFYVTDAGVLMVREGGVGQRVTLKNPKDAELVKDLVPLRDALKQAHYDQLNDGDWEPSLRGLQQAYAAFVKKHGQINQYTTKMVKTKTVDEETGETFTDEEPRHTYPLLDKLKDDPDYTLVAALEKVNDDTGEITQSAFLTQRVLGKPAAAQISTPTDALLSVLNDTGEVNMAAIAHRLGLSEDEAAEALGSAVYMDPEGSWTTADEYLSGNVKRKLQVAREAVKADRRLERNVTALEAAQPEPKTPSQINASMGMNWIPGEVYAQFLKETTGVSANVQWNDRTKQWIVQEMDGGKTMAATADWGTGSRNATDLLEHALTGRPVRVTAAVGTGADRKTVFDATATEAANDKLEKLKDEFQSWIWRDADRTDALVRSFNDKFNTTVPRTFDGRHLTLPGTSKTYNIFDHVKRGAWRIIQSGNTYLAHAVGSGKTFQMVIAAMEQKRLGLINKPMIVVPNHMLKQFASEWQDLYPAARLMVADENNFHTENRRRFVSRVALSDLDGVIITHSAFKLLDLDPEFKTKMIEEQLAYLRAALEEAGGKEGEKGKSRDPKIKQIEKQIENMEQKLQAAMSSTGKDANVRFDELGVDFLMVDEAHEFRKLDFTTTRQVKGISPAGSARAFDLYMKSRYLEEKTPGRSLVMASGTPVTNTLAELFTVQRFMDRQALIDRNIDDFDSWAAMFGRERTALEPNAAGKYEPVTRFSKFVNVPELTQMFREYADVLTSDNLAAMLGDKRPSVENGSRRIVITPKTSAYADYQGELAQRVKASRDWKPSKDEPNNPDPIIRIIGDGRLAAIDMRFINPSLQSDPDSKLNRMVDDVIRVFKDAADMEFKDKAGKVEPNKGASMMVFSDLGFGAGVAANRGFNARAWFEKRLRDAGVPMGQVAFMSDYKKSSEKLKLFKDVNAGRVRLLIGSSKNMGTGVNAQQRLKALFHLDSPWYPSDLEQREGRIVRQGNKNPLVQLYAYAAKGTYDENMWKMLASKQYFIDQALSGDQTLREIEDLDSQSQYDLAAAMVAEDPRVLQLAGAKAEIEKLGRLYKAHEDQRYRFKQEYDHARATVEFNQAHMAEAEAHAGKAQDLSGDNFVAKAGSKTFDSRQDWAQALIEKYKTLSARVLVQTQTVGEVSGFKIAFMAEDVKGAGYFPRLVLETPVPITLVENAEQPLMGIAMRATNAIAELARLPSRMRERISEAQAKMDALESRLQSPFPMAGMLADKIKEAAAIEAELLAVPTKNVTETLWGDMAVNVEVDDASDIMLSRSSAAAGQGVSVDGLAALAERLHQTMPNMPRVNVLADPSQAPKKLRDHIAQQGATADVEGALHGGELYLFSSGLRDMARAEHVLAAHEAAHFGLRAILAPKELKTALRMIWVSNAAVRKAATELQRRGKLTETEATEEVIVDIPSAELARLKGWRKVVQAVADYLGRRGYSQLQERLSGWLAGTLSEQQRADLFVADLVRAARAYVQGQRPGLPRGLGSTTRLSGSLAEDLEKQEQWLAKEARARGYKDIDTLVDQDYPLFEKLAKLWREKNPADEGVLLSRGAAPKTAIERAEAIIQDQAASAAPLDAAARALTRITGVERLTGAVYNKAAQLLDRYTPERVKAGIVSDYGVPEAVIDQRTLLQARQRVQLRKAGELVEKLATLTRAESRVAYEWMNMDGNDPQAYVSMMQGLPEESVKVLQDVQKMIDQLSQEAVRLGQLDADAFARNRFAYLRRSYAKHTLEQTAGQKAKRSRTIAVLGEQYKGRGLSESAPMDKIKAVAPDWWGRKLAKGKADAALKGEKFLRLEYRTHKQSGAAVRVTLSGKGKPYYITRSVPLNTKTGQFPGLEVAAHETKLREVVYWPAGEKIPAQYSEWDQAGTWEVRDVKGPNAIFWRDFTKDERESMGEIDEARFAIAKTLHAMIHDVEVGRYLEWLAARHAKKEGETIPGTVVEASERMRDTFAPGEWVRVPDSKIQGTNVPKYGKLAGRYLPGPVWNDLRQVVGGQFQPFGETYSKILSLWKTSKTALSPAVHMNNVMSNFVMADWHDVHATQVGKALRILLAASQKPGGMADREAAVEILNRYKDSGGDAGSWVTQEISREQIEPLLESLQNELAATNGQSVAAQTGIFAALQHAMQLRFPEAWDAAKAGRGGKIVAAAGGALIDLYQSEDDVFRLAAWLAAKERGATDMEAGKLARKSFLDYNINAPWINAMRKSAWPFLSFTYRAVPMLLETAAKKPHKIMKLMALAGALNALGVMLAGGGGDDDERKMLPEEKAGGIWGMVPKLIRMPWNDAHGSPVYLDIRRWVPVGDVLDVGQGHAAVPILPGLMPGGPLVLMGEVVLNRSAFTGKPITLETDTPTQQAAKLGDYLYKSFAPNVLVLPNTYATEGVVDSMTGRTDAFGREMSTAQAVASSFGVKVGSYPADVMRRNLTAATLAQSSEIDKNISQLKRQLQTGRIDQAEFQELAKVEQEKKVKLMQKLAEKTR